jgi:hypothetical protein
VTTRNRDRIDGFATQFIGDLPEIPIVMAPQIFWALYIFQHTASGFRNARKHPAMAFLIASSTAKTALAYVRTQRITAST